jgi:membrane-associated phospholipid phosphatase
MLAVTVVMCPAVVYLRAHYAVDVAAGILMGPFIAIIADRIPLALKNRGCQGWGRAQCAGLLTAR